MNHPGRNSNSRITGRIRPMNRPPPGGDYRNRAAAQFRYLRKTFGLDSPGNVRRMVRTYVRHERMRIPERHSPIVDITPDLDDRPSIGEDSSPVSTSPVYGRNEVRAAVVRYCNENCGSDACLDTPLYPFCSGSMERAYSDPEVIRSLVDGGFLLPRQGI